MLKGFPEVERVYSRLMENERIKSQVDAEFMLPVTAQYGLKYKELSEGDLEIMEEKKLFEASTFVVNGMSPEKLPEFSFGFVKKDGGEIWDTYYE